MLCHIILQHTIHTIIYDYTNTTLETTRLQKYAAGGSEASLSRSVAPYGYYYCLSMLAAIIMIVIIIISFMLVVLYYLILYCMIL